MTNREKYIIKRNEYDLMMTIAENIQGIGTFCPIKVIGGKDYMFECSMPFIGG